MNKKRSSIAGSRSHPTFPITNPVYNREGGFLQPFPESGETTTERTAPHFQMQTEGILTNPYRDQQKIEEWNATQTTYSRDRLVHQLFEAQVEQTPEALALISSSRQINYRRLNQLANCLAHHLRDLGVGPEVLVGVCLERSLELVIGQLAILKAGGAYVPLDPGSPPAQLTFQLEDTQVPILLTQQHLIERFTRYQGHLLSLDALEGLFSSKANEQNLPHETQDHHAAYVIYTSGSSGRPKGVVIEHHSLLNLIFWHLRTYQLSPADRMTLLAGVAFDAFVWELWPTLIAGASLYIAEEQVRLSPELLRDWLLEQQITFSFAPTPIAERLLALDWPSEAPLRTLLTGGDTLHHYPAAHLPFQLINLYGPTECTVVTTAILLSNMEEGPSILPPIGYPIANTQVYLLDQQCCPVPIGVVSELYIGGDGLARGYLHQSELTAERFVPNPFSRKPGTRMYKTGDIGRYLPNGEIEFLGRNDDQVKIRGYRIELGEVEMRLRHHPHIQEGVVIATEDTSGEKRLVAYAALDQPNACSVSELRQYLKQHLPDYMVPSTFVLLEALPLTSNGKVDRHALPVSEGVRPELQAAFMAPRNPHEEILMQIWTQLLGLKQVGIYDNFFELGGHSLLVTQLMSRIRDAFAIELPMRTLFEVPTIAQLAEHLEETRQQTFMRHLSSIQPMPRHGDLPLSFAQQRLWFLDQLAPGYATYTIPLALHLHGQLDIRAVEQSLDQIVQRHEVLRTSFPTIEGQAVQRIASTLTMPLPMIDLEALSPLEQKEQVQRLMALEAQRPFDLALGPLMRTQLLHLSEQEHILMMSFHHIIIDGWSLSVLYQELINLYQSLPLIGLPIQYADYALWQRERLQKEMLAKELAYWKQQLADAPMLLELPIDYPRPVVQTFRGAYHSFALPKQLSERLQMLSNREHVTLFMTLLAAFTVLLFRYNGQEDLLVGTPIAGRNHTELEGLIGLFVNTLVLRIDLSGNPPFQELLRRVREGTLDAYAHQNLPFEQLVKHLHPDRNLSYSPIFQVMFEMQNTPVPSLNLPGLHLELLKVRNETVQFDLFLEIEESEQSLRGEWQYNTDLFDDTTIKRMAEHFHILLEGIAANAEQRLSDLPLLSEEERRLLLIEWNTTQSLYPGGYCLHQLFEAQVERTPEAVAVIYKDVHLTYRELNQQANQLAHFLHKLGVGPEIKVALCLERSLDLMIGLLGILKAGGAYVPLDPIYPEERLAFMLQDAQVLALLTQEQLRARLPTYKGRIVCLDTDRKGIVLESLENLLTTVCPNNLAYVIYTSGSTGRPKGVLISHQAVVNHSTAFIKIFDVQSSDRVLQFASISFDAAGEELFPAWFSGARVVLLPFNGAPTYADFMQLLKKEQLTILDLPTAYWHTWVTELRDSSIPLPLSIRLVIVGGEEVFPHQLALWSKHVNQQVEWSNTYGPTEATITTTLYRQTSHLEDQGHAIIPIGRPLANTQIYLLNVHLQLVPIGALGELYISGDGLARGYLHQSELTAERFVPNPFSQEPGVRMYKTGDIGRYLPNGEIEFLGRNDRQVKVRGFRIELGEIEEALYQHPDVREALVLIREDIPNDKRLVAYLVPHQGQYLASPEFRHYLKQRLPEYMLPSAFIWVEALPLTPNGKLDRQRLPAPEQHEGEKTTGYVAPRNPVEEVLALIWAELLGLERVGIHDNFFELGGHSLLATQLIARVHRSLQIELSLRSLFDAPSISGMAEALVHSERVPGQAVAFAQARNKLRSMPAEEISAMLHDKRKMKG